MGRYILRYGAAPSAPDEHVRTILGTRGVTLIDKSPNMLLVDADEASLREKLGGLRGWSLHPEQHTPLPDTRQKID
jgi:hypothetical protein